MRSVLARPDAVFSLLPLKTEAFARLPRAILLTAFFMTFIAAFFMDFIAEDFITDFFMGRAMLRQQRGAESRAGRHKLLAGLGQLSTYLHSICTVCSMFKRT